ncbi:MAG: class I SAM-dependent methyltransferase [Propionivibrio sp.]|nr:class I SAM-dependent methyltransferase [Propionivibrio sp.]
MSIRSIVRSLVPTMLVSRYKRRHVRESSGKFAFKFDSALEVKKDIQKKYGHNSDLLDLFVGNEGALVHKWHHYIPLYDRYFGPFRAKKIRFLEIGVSKGGSLQMWRKYFGDEAIIFGIDINPECGKFNGQAGQVRIGSQTDHYFLDSVVKEMGGIDVVLDDGSHHMEHVSATLEYLFPHLNYGGIYMVEDLHTAYWKRFGGGYGSGLNFFRVVMDAVNDMHHWYHAKGLKRSAISNHCSGIHIHDSIVVLEKNRVYEPVNSKIG